MLSASGKKLKYHSDTYRTTGKAKKRSTPEDILMIVFFSLEIMSVIAA